MLLKARSVEIGSQDNFHLKCEDVKNRCLILLAVDRFSDFLADKSNIINRALASEVLVTVFELNPNLTENLFIIQHLLEKNFEDGWEPKQAVFFLLTQILNAQKEAFSYKKKRSKREQKKKNKLLRQSKKKNSNNREHRIGRNFQIVSENLNKFGSKTENKPKKSLVTRKLSKKHKNLENLKLMEEEMEFETFFKEKAVKFAKGPVLDDVNLARILENIPRVITEHEEISEVCCEFLLSVLRTEFFSIGNEYWLKVQSKLNQALLKSEDISYLPKSAFEFLIEILKRRIPLSPDLKEDLDSHLNKFMFHDNFEVRSQVYQFVSQLFSDQESSGMEESILSPEKTKKFFLTFFFYASLMHASFSKYYDPQIFPAVAPELILSKSKSRLRIKKPMENELEKICEILFKILKSLSTDKFEILGILLKSLDIVNLNNLFKETSCSFNFNLENYITEADPQKMLYIVFNILKQFQFDELNQMFSNHFDSGVIAKMFSEDTGNLR